MSGAATHVAPMNIGLLNHPLDDPRKAGFTGNAGTSESAYGFKHLRHRAQLEAE